MPSRTPSSSLIIHGQIRQQQRQDPNAAGGGSSSILLYAKKKQKRPPRSSSSKSSRGAGGFGSSATQQPSKSKPLSRQSVLKKVQRRYGGTTAQDIAQGTQREIDRAMAALPVHLQTATQLYQKLQGWDARLAGMDILQQATIPPAELAGAQRAREELAAIYQQHNLTERDLHNVFQQVTWDASADAKAARAVTGNMPPDIARRVQKACDVAAEAVLLAASSSSKDDAADAGRCLDVGCGFGVLVPFLRLSGLQASQIVGIDLSPEMIRNAQEQHPNVEFHAGDFLSYPPFLSGDSLFDAITFCASLHDLPDMIAALEKAASLLKPGGKLVIVHPQGASHVLNQARSNPILVQRGLPDGEELERLTTSTTQGDDDDDLLKSLRVTVQPARANSPEESRLGYLAVLEKERSV